MGGGGDLLSLSLTVPQWEDLHELSAEELRLTNLVTTNAVAEVFSPTDNANGPVAELPAKPTQDRFASETVSAEKPLPLAASPKSTKTAEAIVPTGGAVTAPAQERGKRQERTQQISVIPRCAIAHRGCTPWRRPGMTRRG